MRGREELEDGMDVWVKMCEVGRRKEGMEWWFWR